MTLNPIFVAGRYIESWSKVWRKKKKSIEIVQIQKWIIFWQKSYSSYSMLFDVTRKLLYLAVDAVEFARKNVKFHDPGAYAVSGMKYTKMAATCTAWRFSKVANNRFTGRRESWSGRRIENFVQEKSILCPWDMGPTKRLVPITVTASLYSGCITRTAVTFCTLPPP